MQGPESSYQDYLAKGEFRIQRCNGCKSHVFYPRLLCPHCGSSRLEWIVPSGAGTVYSTTGMRRRPDAGGGEEQPGIAFGLSRIGVIVMNPMRIKGHRGKAKQHCIGRINRHFPHSARWSWLTRWRFSRTGLRFFEKHQLSLILGRDPTLRRDGISIRYEDKFP